MALCGVSNARQISGINITRGLQTTECQARGGTVQASHPGRLGWEPWWGGGVVHVLDNDCQLLYKYFNIFSAVKQNNEQMRKSQSLTSWDEFPLCTVLEISHHASLQAAQTWKYFKSTPEIISIKISWQWWSVRLQTGCWVFWKGLTNILTSCHLHQY